MRKRKVFAIALIILTAAALFFNLGIAHVDNPKKMKDELFQETCKFFIQFVMLTFIGSILVQEYNRIRQRSADLKEFRKGISRSLIDLYLDTKRTRWKLRAGCNDTGIDWQLCKESINKLVDIKAELEVVQYEINADSKAFKETEKKALEEHFKAMEDFFRKIINEYNTRVPVNGASPCRLQDLEYLAGFLKPGEAVNGQKQDSYFGQNFRKHFKDALILITNSNFKTTE